MKYFVVCMLVGFVLLGAGCQQEQGSVFGPEQARQLILDRQGQAGFVVLDVRTEDEFRRGHLPGAVLMDLYSRDFKSRLGQLDRSATVLVYCAVGGRSMWVQHLGQSMGFTRMYDLQGGFQAWANAGLPVEK